MSQNTGLVPDGGLERHSLEESPAATPSASKNRFTKPRREQGDYLPLGIRDKYRNTEERCETKASCPVLEQR
jgi:hypothetical protein